MGSNFPKVPGLRISKPHLAILDLTPTCMYIYVYIYLIYPSLSISIPDPSPSPIQGFPRLQGSLVMPKTGQVLGSKELNSQEFRRTGVRGSSEVPEVAPPLVRNGRAFGVLGSNTTGKHQFFEGNQGKSTIFVDKSW